MEEKMTFKVINDEGKEVECEEIWYCRITISFWVYN